MNSDPIKCSVCGKFISNADLESNQVHIEFIPDTDFTTEQTYYTHKKCELFPTK